MKCTVMERVLIVLGIFGFILQVRCENVYYNYSVVRLTPTHPLPMTHKFDTSPGVEVLKHMRMPNDSMEMLVPAKSMDEMREVAKVNDMLLEILHQNYGRVLESSHPLPRRRALRGFQIYEYNSFAEIQRFMAEAARMHPNLVQLQDLGKSYEGRKMKLAKISAQPDAGNPIIFIDAGIHSREWVAPAMAMYLFNRLIEDPDEIQIGGMLDGVDWYILPVVNPDGYEYSRSGPNNRLWRKTRSRTPGSRCYGVDGNRNYGFKWAVSGVSNDPCHAETFAGPKAFSEPETRMVSNVMMDNKNRIKLYVSLHSYGQYLVYPWGYTGDYLPKKWKKLDAMARAVSAAVTQAGGKPFKVLSAGKWYPAAGGSDDFAFGAAGVPYSYTMELTEGYDFTFPENQLRKVLPQFYAGFKEFSVRIRKEFGHQRQHKSNESKD